MCNPPISAALMLSSKSIELNHTPYLFLPFPFSTKTRLEASIGLSLMMSVSPEMSQMSVSLIDERKKVKLKRDRAVSDDMTGTSGRKYNDLNKAVKNSCKRDKKQWIESKCQDARSLYKIVRYLTGSRANTSIPIKNKAGTTDQVSYFIQIPA